MRAPRDLFWRDFRIAVGMQVSPSSVTTLRAEARLLTIAGLILLAVGLPLTLWLASLALSPDGISPVLPAAIGAPPLLLGYLACHFASRRMVKARSIETDR